MNVLSVAYATRKCNIFAGGGIPCMEEVIGTSTHRSNCVLHGQTPRERVGSLETTSFFFSQPIDLFEVRCATEDEQ